MRDPEAVCISAATGEGVDALISTIANRLELDVRRLTVHLRVDDPADKARVAQLYRVARVIEHDVTDGRVTIVADVPRRLVASVGGSAL